MPAAFAVRLPYSIAHRIGFIKADFQHDAVPGADGTGMMGGQCAD
jgi:hypothetical protein